MKTKVLQRKPRDVGKFISPKKMADSLRKIADIIESRVSPENLTHCKLVLRIAKKD